MKFEKDYAEDEDDYTDDAHKFKAVICIDWAKTM